MVDDRVHAPAGVEFAAVVLGVMAFIGLVIAVCSSYALFVANTALIPRIPSVRHTAAALDALVLALVLLAAFTIVGLFRVQIWARYSMIFLGLLDFVVFALMTAGVLVGRAKWDLATLPIPGHVTMTLGDILLALAAIYAALALIGIWWMAYFSTRRVRLLFVQSNPGLTP